MQCGGARLLKKQILWIERTSRNIERSSEVQVVEGANQTDNLVFCVKFHIDLLNVRICHFKFTILYNILVLLLANRHLLKYLTNFKSYKSERFPDFLNIIYGLIATEGIFLFLSLKKN